MKTAVITWLYAGGRPGVYLPEHVRRLRDMVAEHLTIPHDFHVVTDQEVEGVHCVPLPALPWVKHHPGLPSNYVKLWALSNEARALGNRIISLDLDTIILGNLDDLFDDAPFRTMKGISCPYNTSIFQVTPGLFDDVWTDLTPESARKANLQRLPDGRCYFGSDQAVAAWKIPDHPTWYHTDGLYQYHGLRGQRELPDNCRLMFYAGRTKPWSQANKYLHLYWGNHGQAEQQP